MTQLNVRWYIYIYDIKQHNVIWDIYIYNTKQHNVIWSAGGQGIKLPRRMAMSLRKLPKCRNLPSHTPASPKYWVAVEFSLSYQNVNIQQIFRGLRPESGNAGSRGDSSHILSFVAHTCARLSPLQKLDLLKKREREREMYIYILYRGIGK